MINRDFIPPLQRFTKLEAVVLWGPRQVGKTTLLNQLELRSRLFLDDLGARERAQRDPALTLDNLELPCLIDEAQYAPNLFAELKRRIDEARRARLKNNTPPPPTQYFLTGSNRLWLDKNVKESLAGRAHLFALHGLSVHEILVAFPELDLATILFRGGLPELYARPELSVPEYLNAYVSSFVDKDVALSSGVTKLGEFHTVLRLLAARTGQFIQPAEVAQTAGVDQKTVASWIYLLETAGLLSLVAPFATNLSKRITRMKKLHFLDTGLCARLQGHPTAQTLWGSPQVGALFESLVHAELVKTRDNFLLDWHIHTWRTKEQAEVDFVLETPAGMFFIDAKLAIHGARPFELDREALKVFAPPHQKLVVSAGGEVTQLDRQTFQVPVQRLGEYLHAHATRG